MKESATYQATIAEGLAQGIAKGRAKGLAEGLEVGRSEEARNVLVRLGTRRFGKPVLPIQSRLAGMGVEQIERLIDRVLEVESWEELFGQSGKARKQRRRPS